jgi:hypothetical protein
MAAAMNKTKSGGRRITYKDYRDVHERYAAFGARELVVFDPLLFGPKSMGGPFSLQVWRRESGVLTVCTPARDPRTVTR